jgi:thiol-disulfide isomerase/thioredoxin
MRFFRSALRATVFNVGVFLSSHGLAADLQPFSQSVYDAAKASGKTVVVEFHAKWCPSCKKQQPALEAVLKQKEFAEVVALTADYDKEADLKKATGVKKQTTLVVFKGDKEVSRVVGLTDEGSIRSLLAKGL